MGTIRSTPKISARAMKMGKIQACSGWMLSHTPDATASPRIERVITFWLR